MSLITCNARQSCRISSNTLKIHETSVLGGLGIAVLFVGATEAGVNRSSFDGGGRGLAYEAFLVYLVYRNPMLMSSMFSGSFFKY